MQIVVARCAEWKVVNYGDIIKKLLLLGKEIICIILCLSYEMGKASLPFVYSASNYTQKFAFILAIKLIKYEACFKSKG